MQSGKTELVIMESLVKEGRLAEISSFFSSTRRSSYRSGLARIFFSRLMDRPVAKTCRERGGAKEKHVVHGERNWH